MFTCLGGNIFPCKIHWNYFVKVLSRQSNLPLSRLRKCLQNEKTSLKKLKKQNVYTKKMTLLYWVHLTGTPKLENKDVMHPIANLTYT